MQRYMRCVDEMSDFGFGVYIISILSSASIKKLSFVEDQLLKTIALARLRIKKLFHL